VAVICSHFYSAYPQFEVAEEDEDEGALRCTARMSSGRDLVEEFVGYGVWPLARGWALGEVCPRQMPSRGGMLVRSPAFALDLHGRDLSVFWVRPHTRGCPSRCFRSRTVSPTVAKWFVPDARGTMDIVYRFGPL
jgi:hypothetical protein